MNMAAKLMHAVWYDSYGGGAAGLKVKFHIFPFHSLSNFDGFDLFFFFLIQYSIDVLPKKIYSIGV